MKKFLISTILVIITPAVLFASEHIQKDGLFKIIPPDGWNVEEMPGKVFIIPPVSKGYALLINYQVNDGSETEAEIEAEIVSNYDSMVEKSIKPSGGRVLANSDIKIDNVNARLLYYTISSGQETTYFIHIDFVSKGYTYSIDFRNSALVEVDKAMGSINTLKF